MHDILEIPFRFIHFVYDVLPACMYVNYMHTWCSEGYKKMSDPLKLELQIVVSHNGGS